VKRVWSLEFGDDELTKIPATHHSPLPIHYSQFTIAHSPFTIHSSR